MLKDMSLTALLASRPFSAYDVTAFLDGDSLLVP
jgi:hypothetical protein